MELKHPHFIRNPKGNLILQKRDLKILKFVYEHDAVDLLTLSRLLGHHGSAWAFQSRVQRLFHHGYLGRPPQQLVLRTTGEVRHMIYTLGREGARLLSEHYGLALDPRRWTQRNQEITDLYLRHTLGISRFRACLRLAIPQSAPREGIPDYSQPYLLPWQYGNAIKAQVLLPGKVGSREPWHLCPDGFFGIQAATPPPNRSYFFLEFQRTTPHPRRFIRSKGLAYHAAWTAGVYKERLGIQGFRVLVIAPTDRTKETLRRYIREWLAREPGPSEHMWLFATQSSYDVEHPETMLAPIWKTVNEERLISLFD